MALSSGDRLGHYVITAPLGAGGMGEVYRATDPRLDRDVAIKVIPEDLATDPERLARFEREAKTLASLNHPNIATLYGLETYGAADSTVGEGFTPSRETAESGGGADSRPQAPTPSNPVTFLVMELVEGDDLEEELANGPIPLKRTVEIGRQVADGLEAAHTKGIVHRDLKPANIRISTDGTVKILDFGLAKAWEQPHDDVDLEESPTLTAEMTREGTILGTAPYLSPEQARGQPVDRQADIWAFGCVLYEMLTGRRAFAGSTSTEVLARILEREPDWSVLAPTVPPVLRRLLGRCLEKEPKRRLRDAGDLGIALEDLDLDLSGEAMNGSRPSSNPTMKLLPWLVATMAVIMGIVGFTMRSPDDRPKAMPTLWFTETSPTDIDILGNHHSGSAVAISSDGHVLAWVGGTETGTQLWSRHLDEGEAHPVSGTERAQAPFFLPGRRVDRVLGRREAEKGGGARRCAADHLRDRAHSWRVLG